MTEATERMRTIYFAREVGQLSPVKIGCSVAPEKRVQSMAAQMRCPLEIVATVSGCMNDEFRIHSLFWHDHEGGEWFKWSPVLQLVIDAAARHELNINALPPKRVRPMPGKRRPWTEAQRQAARANRAKAKSNAWGSAPIFLTPTAGAAVSPAVTLSALET